MDDKEKGAWLLAHSKKLDQAVGAQRFENIHFAGTVGRLLNILRRETHGAASVEVNAGTVQHLSQLNGIDVGSRREGLRLLKERGLVDLGSDGSVEVLGANTRVVLEATSAIFEDNNHSKEESAILFGSSQISERPQDRGEIREMISDGFGMRGQAVDGLLNVAVDAALIDQEVHKDKMILFSQNVFRDADMAKKAYYLLESLSGTDQQKVNSARALLEATGTVLETEIVGILGRELYERLLSVGFFDRMEVNNSSEAVGYVASPTTFQRYGKPFEEDPVDDAKALLASFTYGMERSSFTRGKIALPKLLIGKLVSGGIVGDEKPVRAIGEDYREVERRGVIQVIPAGNDRYRMKLLKKDVGELALAIIEGKSAAEESLLLSNTPAKSFAGPEENRTSVRRKKSVGDQRFIVDALESIRTGD